MNSEQVLALIRERAKTDHAALLRALDLLLDDKHAGMREVGGTKGGNARARGYADACGVCADHIEEALCEAFDLWPEAD